MAASVEAGRAGTAFAGAREPLAPAPGRVWAPVDRLLAPQADRLSADEMRRARLAVALCASIALIAAVANVNLMLHGVWGNVPISLGSMVMAAIVPILLRRTGSLALAGNAIAGVLAIGLSVLKFNTGATSVPPFILMPAIPLLAALIAGPWSGAFWAGFALVEIGFFYALAANGLEPSIDLDPDHLFRGRYVGSAMMVVFVLMLARSYERLKNRALEEMNQARWLAEQRSRELEETRRQQLEIKDRFISHVSHELRTPLTALHQFVSLVLDGVAGELNEEQGEYLAVAFRNAEQLRHMIDDLMDLNRARDGKLRVECDVFALAPVLLDTLRGLEAKATQKRIRLQSGIADGLPVVRGDPTRVRQVVANLVENALKFTPEGGRIDAVVAADPEDDAFLRVSIRDTGCGIEPVALERIFNRLHQEQAAETDSRLGLGLGLAISKELVQRQGGEIWVESELGRGSVFHFTLPVFSLARALRPCVFEEGRLVQDFSIVSIALRGGTLGSSGLRRGVLHLLRSTVFYPEKDVVLPYAAAGEAEDHFTVLAAADAHGVESLMVRLRIRMTRFAQERGMESDAFCISARTEQVPTELAQRSQDEALEILAGRVGEFLRNSGRKDGGESCSLERS